MGIGVPEAEGAHVHTYLGRPDVDEEQFDIWVRSARYEVVGICDMTSQRHLIFGPWSPARRR